MRAMVGRRVCVFDLDKQRSAYLFAQERSGRDVAPPIRAVSGYLSIPPGQDPVPHGRALVKNLRATAADFDDVLVDVGGTDNPAFRFAMLAAERFFVPIPPTQFDVWALADIARVYAEVSAGRPDDMKLVAFPCLVSPQTTEREAYEAIRDAYPVFDWAPAGVAICARSAYRRTLGEGRGIFDAPRPDPKARSELLGLYRLVFGEDWRKNG
jgi:chromosome partitioning protein